MDFTERLNLYLEGGMIDEKDVRDVNRIIELFHDEYGVTLLEENADTFIAHICAAYSRLKSGEDVEELPEVVLDEVKALDSWPLSVKILERVMAVTENPLNETEQGYALLHINNLIARLQETGEWHTGN